MENHQFSPNIRRFDTQTAARHYLQVQLSLSN